MAHTQQEINDLSDELRSVLELRYRRPICDLEFSYIVLNLAFSSVSILDEGFTWDN